MTPLEPSSSENLGFDSEIGENPGETPGFETLIEDAEAEAEALDDDAEPMGEDAFFGVFCAAFTYGETARATVLSAMGRNGQPYQTLLDVPTNPKARPASDALYDLLLNSMLRFIVVGPVGEASGKLAKYMPLLAFGQDIFAGVMTERAQRAPAAPQYAAIEEEQPMGSLGPEL